MTENNFIKIGDRIEFKQNIEGLEYSLEAGKVYTIEIDRYTDEMALHLSSDFKLPEKIYSTEEDDEFLKRVLKHYKNTNSGNTGVMFSGVKGTGKTVSCKRLALMSNLPIILIDKGFRPSFFKKLFNKLQGTEICIVFDEIDKIGENYDSSYLLTILDGINSTGKSLILFTCNDERMIDDNLIDRCSRIRYWVEFEETSKDVIKNILNDRLNNKDIIDNLYYFIQKNFNCLSYDNICSFVDEINENQDVDYTILFKYMNLSNK